MLLALDHDIKLIAYILKTAQNLSVSVGEVEDGVRNTRVGAEIAEHELHLAEVVSRHTGEKMVNGLELKTAVDEVQPGRAVDIHSCSKLTLRKRFLLAEINSRHTPVRKGNLDMQRHGDDVGDQDEDDTGGPVRESAPEEAVAEEEPVACHEADLGRANPPSA